MGGIRDGYSNFKFFEAISPGSTIGVQAITGETIDRRGYETVLFTFGMDASISGKASGDYPDYMSGYFLRMQHGESNPAGTVVWSNCVASQMLFDMTFGGVLSGLSVTSYGWLQTTSCGSGIDEGVCCHFGVGQSNLSVLEDKVLGAGYTGTRRWVRLMLSCSAAADVSTVGFFAQAILGLPGEWPVNAIKRDVTSGRQ